MESSQPSDSSSSVRVTVVVVNWNSPELVLRTMESLRDGVGDGLSMVIVDNGSVDGSAEVIQGFLSTWEHSSAVTLIRSETNLGFCGAVNLGTAEAMTGRPGVDYIWSLNPDAVVRMDTLRELVAVARESEAGIVGIGGGKRIDGNGERWPRTFWWPTVRARWVPVVDRWWFADRYEGSCALFDVRVIRALVARDGTFLDEGLFMYWDERDTSLRAKSLGWSVAVSRDANIIHQGGKFHGRSKLAAARRYYLARNSIVVAKRHLGRFEFWWMLPPHVFRDLAWLCRSLLRGRYPNFGGYLHGLFDGLRGKTGMWKHHPPSPDAKA